jgi:hypothetical protein
MSEALLPLAGAVSLLAASGTGTLRERTVAARPLFARRVRRSKVRRVPWVSLSFFFCDAESGPMSWMSEYLVGRLLVSSLQLGSEGGDGEFVVVRTYSEKRATLAHFRQD